MARDKHRFVFITRLLPQPSNISAESLEEETPAPTERVHRFFDSGPPQTTLGIVGGLVGTFLDGRYYALLGLYLVYGMIRSKALRGLDLGVRLWLCTAAAIVFCGGFFWLGVHINRAKPHVYTPGEYLAAVKAGTPLPITQQVTNQFFPTTNTVIDNSPPRHTHIMFDQPTLLSNGKVNVGYHNRGSFIVLHASFVALVDYREDSKYCDPKEFDTFRRGAIFHTEGPMLDQNSYVWRSLTPQGSPSKQNLLHFSGIVRWGDDTGTYETSTSVYYDYSDGQWHTCGFNNGEKKVGV